MRSSNDHYSFGYNLSSLRQAIKDGYAPEFVFFWSGKEVNERAVGPECLSQWYPASFSVGDTTYSTAEHFMMAEKARIFGDRVVLQRILKAPSPKKAKQLGRQVRGFDEQTWVQERLAVAVRGNQAKFQQNERLRRYLIETEERVLAEASPHDSVWGIGLSATDVRAPDPFQWEGQNLLGFAVMRVRAVLSRVRS